MKLTCANQITIFRILMVPLFISVVLYYTPQREYLRFIILAIFLVAVVSDFIDGFIARTHRQESQVGAFLDPLADKLLLMSAFICLYKVGVHFPSFRFPVWLVVIVMSRDIILLIGAMLIVLNLRHLPMSSSVWGKCSTFFQVLTVIAMLCQWDQSAVLWILTVVFAVVSGWDYISQGVKLINSPAEKTASPIGYSTPLDQGDCLAVKARLSQSSQK